MLSCAQLHRYGHAGALSCRSLPRFGVCKEDEQNDSGSALHSTADAAPGRAVPKAPRHPRGRGTGSPTTAGCLSGSSLPGCAGCLRGQHAACLRSTTSIGLKDNDHDKGLCPTGDTLLLGTLMQAIPAFSGCVNTLQRKAHSLLLCKLPEQ